MKKLIIALAIVAVASVAQAEILADRPRSDRFKLRLLGLDFVTGADLDHPVIRGIGGLERDHADGRVLAVEQRLRTLEDFRAGKVEADAGYH